MSGHMRHRMLIGEGHPNDSRNQPELMMTDLEGETPEVCAADADSIQRMDQLRAALVADMRHTTAAVAKGNRKMVIGASASWHQPACCEPSWRDAGSATRRMIRATCRRPCCGVCMQRQARWLLRSGCGQRLENVPATQMRWSRF